MRKPRSGLADLTDGIYGRLTVIALLPERTARGQRIWRCRCECGKETTALGYDLTGGEKKSCGCLQAEKRAQGNPKHGCRHMDDTTPEYTTWNSMRARCNNPKNAGYKNYGGRGIFVCPEWDDFARFLADMGTRPTPKHSLERRDNSGPYAPDNCYWATRTAQARNKRNTRMITANGKTQPAGAWADELGVSPTLIHSRLFKGWSEVAAVTTPKWAGGPKPMPTNRT